MDMKKLSKDHEGWIETRTERQIFEDHMYEEYKLEKKKWGETDVLSRKDYLKSNKLFLEESFTDWEQGLL